MEGLRPGRAVAGRVEGPVHAFPAEAKFDEFKGAAGFEDFVGFFQEVGPLSIANDLVFRDSQ